MSICHDKMSKDIYT